MEMDYIELNGSFLFFFLLWEERKLCHVWTRQEDYDAAVGVWRQGSKERKRVCM